MRLCRCPGSKATKHGFIARANVASVARMFEKGKAWSHSPPAFRQGVNGSMMVARVSRAARGALLRSLSAKAAGCLSSCGQHARERGGHAGLRLSCRSEERHLLTG